MIQLSYYQAMFMSRFAPFLWFILPFVLLDVILKAWGMWRAARMGKNIWFLVLLIINSVGILPAIFLLMTKDEYAKKGFAH